MQRIGLEMEADEGNSQKEETISQSHDSEDVQCARPCDHETSV